MMTCSDLYDSAAVWLANGQVDRAKRISLDLLDVFNRGGDRTVSREQVSDIVARSLLSTNVKQDAADALEHSVSLVDYDPSSVAFLSNLSTNWLKLHLVDHAIDCAEKAIQADPSNVDGYVKMANALHGANRHVDALVWDRKVYEIRKGKMDAVSIGLSLMTVGDGNPNTIAFHDGMRWMANRYVSPHTRPHTNEIEYPIMLEQGLGDCVMMMPYLLQSGRHVFGCGTHKTHNDVINAMSMLKRDDSRFSVSKSLSESPHELMFGLMIEPGMEKDCHWPILDKPLPTDHKGLVGVCWRGNPKHPNDYFRSIPFDEIVPVLEQYGDKCVVLQMDITEYERSVIERIGCKIYDREGLVDLIGTIHGLSQLICVDTACAHIAGRYQVPTKLMLSTMVDWRWGTEGRESFWYSSVGLFRQSKLGDWSSVIHEVLSK